MYDYKKMKPQVFLEENQEQFLKFRERVKYLLETSGAFTTEKAIKELTGDSFLMLAYIDRLIELKEIKLIYKSYATQFDVYIEDKQ